MTASQRSGRHEGPPSGDQIVVWSADLDHDQAITNELARSLSHDETKRADRYRVERDRNRFVTARGILRQLIGGYLEMSPDRVRFKYGPHGKPYLDDQDRQLRFNISHSQGLALFAFASGREIGVDVEHKNNNIEISKLAHYVFDQHEMDGFLNLSFMEQAVRFYAEWTQKEAVSKAAGVGIAAFINTINERPRRSGGALYTFQNQRFHTSSLALGREHTAAIAAEERSAVIEYRQWPQN